ncbi:MAG: universal stress protein UspA [Ardenticatenaceae bacterium]|nr:MAG: universal stress protein UspA [Ardenticatenaceae bacterium]
MSFNKILLPLDGSELAETALAPAVALAEAFSAEIVLLRVVVPLSIKLDPDLYQRIIDGGQKEAKRYLTGLQLRSLFSMVQLKSEIVVGKAAESILDFAHENGVDLIVMSSHGRSGMSRWVYGSVADKVLHKATCSLAIIHPQVKTEPFAHKRILVPLDGSLQAESALGPALQLAHKVAAELVLLRVAEMPPIPKEPVAGWPGVEVVMQAAEMEARTYLERSRRSLIDSHVQISTQVATGSVAESIIDAANELQTDLIVMSSHGRSGIDRWVFGSVTEKTLRGAHCPTVVIR